MHLCGTPEQIILKCGQSGISWLAIHMDSVTTELVKTFHDAGLYVGAWKYCVPGDDFIDHAILCARSGCDAILPDCEIEWEAVKNSEGLLVPTDRRAEAAAFAKSLRDALSDPSTGTPTVFIGNCGAWQFPDSHPFYPDHSFGAEWDAGLVERYWTMLNAPAAQSLQKSESQWGNALNAGAYKRIIPIGSAFDGRGQGGSNVTAEDVEMFLNRQETCALWSWQHLPAEVWAMLARRAAAQVSTLPPSAPPA